MERVCSEQKKKLTQASAEEIETYVGKKKKKHNEDKGRDDIADKLAVMYPCKMGTRRQNVSLFFRV